MLAEFEVVEVSVESLSASLSPVNPTSRISSALVETIGSMESNRLVTDEWSGGVSVVAHAPNHRSDTIRANVKDAMADGRRQLFRTARMVTRMNGDIMLQQLAMNHNHR